MGNAKSNLRPRRYVRWACEHRGCRAAYQQLWILGIIVYSAILGVTACVVTAFAKAIGDGRFVVSILASYIL